MSPIGHIHGQALAYRAQTPFLYGKHLVECEKKKWQDRQ